MDIKQLIESAQRCMSNDVCVGCDINPCVGASAMHIADAYDQGKADAAPKWIPVTENTPNEFVQRVLATLKNGMVLELFYINNEFKHNEPGVNGGMKKVHEHNPVVAWQPLPEPWKGEADESSRTETS